MDSLPSEPPDTLSNTRLSSALGIILPQRLLLDRKPVLSNAHPQGPTPGLTQGVGREGRDHQPSTLIKGCFTKAAVLNHEPPLYHHRYSGSFFGNFCRQENIKRGWWQRSLTNYLKEKKILAYFIQKASLSHSISWGQTCPLWCHGSVMGSQVDLILFPNWNKREVGSKESCSGVRSGGTNSPLEASRAGRQAQERGVAGSKRAALLRGPERTEHLSAYGGSPRGSTNLRVPPAPQAELHWWWGLLPSLRLRTPDR